MTNPAYPESVPEAEATEYGRMLAALKKEEPAVQLAGPLVEGFRPSAPDISAQIEAIEDPARPWKIRRLAAWSLGLANLKPDQKTQAASALMTAAYGINPGFSRVGTRIAICLIALAPLSGLIAAIQTAFGPHSFEILWLIAWIASTMICLPIYLPISLAIDDRRRNRVRAECVSALGRLSIPSTVLALLDALLDGTPEMSAAAERVLPRILELLNVEHYGRSHFSPPSSANRLGCQERSSRMRSSTPSRALEMVPRSSRSNASGE